MSPATCSHLDTVHDVVPGDNGCHECLQTGDWWVHLRICEWYGHGGCCDDSPNRHATRHNAETGHPLIRPFEPGEDWWWCYAEQLLFEVEGAPPAPSHR